MAVMRTPHPASKFLTRAVRDPGAKDYAPEKDEPEREKTKTKAKT
jgi:hypothetical protein